MTDIVLAAGIRTPFGDFGKSLREIPLTDLAAHAAKASISRSGLKPTDIDHVVFGSTLFPDRDTLFGGRVVGIKAGLPEEVPALNVTRACGTGLQALVSASQQIKEGQSSIALAVAAKIIAGCRMWSPLPATANSAAARCSRINSIGPTAARSAANTWARRLKISPRITSMSARRWTTGA